MSRGQIYLLGLCKCNLVDSCMGRLAHEAWVCLQHSCCRPGNCQEDSKIAVLYLNPSGMFACIHSKASHQDLAEQFMPPPLQSQHHLLPRHPGVPFWGFGEQEQEIMKDMFMALHRDTSADSAGHVLAVFGP